MKVLAIGVDKLTRTFLEANGFAVEVQDISDPDDLLFWLGAGPYDAGAVDLERSKLGVYCTRNLRVRKVHTPVLGISRGSEGQPWSDLRAQFLENGGDDLLRHPVNPRELFAVLRAITRRQHGVAMDIIERRLGRHVLKVNRAAMSVTLNGHRLDLTTRELALLVNLASNPGRVLSKETLVEKMYTGTDADEPMVKIIDVFVCKVRNKLKQIDPQAARFIETVWGQGYRFPKESEQESHQKHVA